MKTLYLLIMTTFLSTGWSQHSFANHDIEGRWKNARTNVALEIEKTYDGIRVKRLDRSGWISYDSFRGDQFRDHQGNTYELRSDGTLEWESYQGSKRLRFTKDEYYNDRSEHFDDHDQSYRGNNYVERNYRKGKGYGHISLEGKWINKSSGQTIYIKERRRSLKVKAHRGGWTDFDRNRGNGFVDHHGNRYEFRSGRLTYTSYSGDFMMRFVKYR